MYILEVSMTAKKNNDTKNDSTMNYQYKSEKMRKNMLLLDDLK